MAHRPAWLLLAAVAGYNAIRQTPINRGISRERRYANPGAKSKTAMAKRRNSIQARCVSPSPHVRNRVRLVRDQTVLAEGETCSEIRPSQPDG